MADERKHTGFEANAESSTKDFVTEFTVRCQEYQEQKEAAEDASRPDDLKMLVNPGMNPSRITFGRFSAPQRFHSSFCLEMIEKHLEMFSIQQTLEVIPNISL